MKRMMFIAYCLIATFIFNSNSYAKEADECRRFTIKESEKFRKECNDKYLTEDRTYVTMELNQSLQENNECLKQHIIKEAKKGFKKEQQKEIIDYINTLDKNLTSFYWMIFNENKYNIGMTGTQDRVLNKPIVADRLDDILKDIIFMNCME